MSNGKSVTQESDPENEVDKVETLRTRLIDAARNCRECSYCTETWVYHESIYDTEGNRYPYTTRCHCHRAWLKVYDELMHEFMKLKKAERDAYTDLITPPMYDFHSISIPDEEIVTPERQAEILREAARIGNKFAEWKTGMEEERW